MQVKIDITAEQLIKTALNRYKTQHESPDMLLGNVISELHSNTDSATVIRQAITNSIAEGLLKMERQAMAAESEFASIGQMSLLGELIPEHKIPLGMQTRSAAEVNAWMQHRAELERENLEELRAAFERQEHKAAKFSAWAQATHRICEALQHGGLDPAGVTYAEAINRAQAIQPRHGVDVGAPSGLPLR
jgi:uncharacterized protein YejL (UPF0352 family)